MKTRLKIALFLAFFSIASCVLIFEIKLFPIIEKVAISKGQNRATVIINDAIREVMDELGQEDFIVCEKNSDGSIAVLCADTYKINLVKSLVAKKIEGKIVQGEQRISIPLGNLTGLKLLSGKGPKIKVEVLPVRSVVAEVSSAFSESGINQSWHKIILNVKTNFGVMVLSRSISCNVSDSIVLADTVIVGKVPDAYTDINKIEDEELGDIVDFAASSN